MQLKGHRTGTVYTILFLVILSYLLMYGSGAAWMYPYDRIYPNASTIVSRLLLICVGLAVMSYAFSRNREHLYDEIERLTLTDPLTLLPNRRGIDQILDQLLKEFDREAFQGQSPPPFCLILADLDNFKSINDSCGHLVGDDVLRQAGTRLKETLRATDFVGRWGGEEFIVVLKATDQATGKIVAEKIRHAFSEQNLRLRNGASMRVTLSLGLACYGQKQEMRTFFSGLDERLYQAKAAGKNCVVG